MLFNLLYCVLLAIASPLLAYRMVRHGRYRRGIGEKLLGLSKTRAKEIRGEGPCLWIHAVSVGEVNLLPGLINKLQTRRPDLAIAISSSTDTGYDLACKLFGSNAVFFCPVDFSWAVRRTLATLNPEQLILTELELWPNLIRLARERGCKVNVINGRLSENSTRGYDRFARFTESSFARLNWVGCQNETYQDRFIACGVPEANVSITGSIKFDNAPDCRDTDEVQTLVQWSGVDPWHRVWIMGSTQEGEEAIALSVYNRLREDQPELRLVLVPRHAERFDNVANLIEQQGFQAHRRSNAISLYDQSWNSDTVILVDTIGELRHWWGVGPIATVGGSFGDRGGQNMLEPAGYGSAVSFGPNTKNFASIAENLLESNAAVRVADADELYQFVRRCLNDIPAADSLGRAAKQVVAQHRGAIDRTLEQLLGNLSDESRLPARKAAA